MAVQKQFEGLIGLGESQTWFVWGIPDNDFRVWFVRPYPGSGRPDGAGDEVHWSVTLQTVRVESAGDGSYTHYLTVHCDAVALGPPGVVLAGGMVMFEAFFFSQS